MWLTPILMAVLSVQVAAKPPGTGTNQRNANAVQIAAFRVLLTNVRHPFVPRPTLYCLAVDLTLDPPTEVFAKLSDLPYTLKPLSECVRDDLIVYEAGILAGPYNKLTLGPIKWNSNRRAEMDADAFGAACHVALMRTRKGWHEAPGGGWGCVS